jgi:hypothetical protein
MFLLFVVVQGVHAQQADEKTSPLSTLRVRDELLDQYFKAGINIHFDQTIAIVINQPIEKGCIILAAEQIENYR